MHSKHQKALVDLCEIFTVLHFIFGCNFNFEQLLNRPLWQFKRVFNSGIYVQISSFKQLIVPFLIKNNQPNVGSQSTLIYQGLNKIKIFHVPSGSPIPGTSD